MRVAHVVIRFEGIENTARALIPIGSEILSAERSDQGRIIITFRGENVPAEFPERANVEGEFPHRSICYCRTFRLLASGDEVEPEWIFLRTFEQCSFATGYRPTYFHLFVDPDREDS